MYKINYINYNWLVHFLHNRAFRANIDHLKGRVIDLGCGMSPYKQDILARTKEYIGVDWDNSVHDVNPDVVADLSKEFPFEDNYADTLISFQVLEHLPTPQLYLKECYRILKPGGVLLLSVPFQWRVHEAPYDYYRFTRYGLDYLFSEAGFQNPVIEELGKFWYTWLLKINYFIATKFALGPLRYLFFPYWFFNQVLALLLDRLITSEQEAGAYFTIARKDDNS
jgi:SAM-dependent methyltransferase